jgi:AcrR family transcriptional regulator
VKADADYEQALAFVQGVSVPGVERDEGPRKRQARGERRMAQIVDAAAEVFAEVGYEAATTNAVAARAGVSPGSLYQFFAGKDDLVRALTEAYATELAAAHDAAFRAEDLPGLALDAAVARVVGQLVRFAREHRAFPALFARTDLPPGLTAATAALHAATLERVTTLLAGRAPDLAPDDLRRAATMTVQLTKAVMPLIVRGDDDSPRYERELRTALTAYLGAALAPAR